MGRLVEGVRFRYFRPSEIASLGDFITPLMPKDYKKDLGLGDFGTLRTIVTSPPRKDDRHTGYSVAQNDEWVLGYAFSGLGILYTHIGRRSVEIPDTFAFVHPDYRCRGIGTRLIEELLSHHRLLRLSPTNFPGSLLANKLERIYGLHGLGNRIIKSPRRKIA